MALKAAPTSCICETKSQSVYSPGLVGDDESIARLIFSPIHIDGQGKVLPAAFSDVDVPGRGLSVNRYAHCTSEELLNLARAKEAMDRDKGKPDREYKGFVVAGVRPVRDITNEGLQAFCVKDTSLKDNISHADVDQDCSCHDLSKSERRRLRRQLQKEFSSHPSMV